MQNIIELLKIMNGKAIKNGDVPVSCVILKNNKIVSKAYNKKYKKNDPLQHAEIIAIKKACKKLKTYNLIDCIMITTLKPCKMCEEIIKESKIKSVYYILNKNKDVNNKIKYYKIDDENSYFENEIKNFFLNKR